MKGQVGDLESISEQVGPALFGLVTLPLPSLLSPSPTLFPQCLWSRTTVARPSFCNYGQFASGPEKTLEKMLSGIQFQ